MELGVGFGAGAGVGVGVGAGVGRFVMGIWMGVSWPGVALGPGLGLGVPGSSVIVWQPTNPITTTKQPTNKDLAFIIKPSEKTSVS